MIPAPEVAPVATSTVRITDDDVGRTVVDAEGGEVGIVGAFRRGTACVDPDPDITTRFETDLGREDHDGGEDYPQHESAVETVTDDRIRLRSDL